MATAKQVAYIRSLVNDMENNPYLAKGERSRGEMAWMMDAIEPGYNHYSVSWNYEAIRDRYLARIAEVRAMDWDAMNNGEASLWIETLKKLRLVAQPRRTRRAR